ncbi:hypothetical protein C1645_816832 [Glomus cerebriforme]|uniref:Transposable element P transposase-like GTP-binding insertion domain-containing protein n=1 Tax=Glomus cerebriforme TaxID=658196 RepID=A0A397TEG0_9GLOM|nr:hypothetical protein C1645_816832 [Glomus cerebriforme]
MKKKHPIFQELIKIQCNKVKGIRYHPMFLQWAISVYSQEDNTAYEAMKSIMRLPSISTLKSYMNKSQQQSGWQNKTTYQILQKITVENIKELQSFMMKCKNELQNELQVENLPNPISSSDHKARENRNHIKSFDWWASSWSLEDIVEVNIRKNNYEKAKIIATNLDCSKFSICLLDPSFPNIFQVDRNLLRPPMPIKSNWNINDSCEFKNPKDNKCHIGKDKGQNIRKIIIDGKEVSWRHIQEVYDYSCQNTIAKISRLTKCYIWLTSWSKIHVDLAEQTLSKEVENAMGMIDELKEIFTETRDFLEIVKKIFILYPEATIEPYRITALVTAEIKSVNYGTSNHTGMDFDYLSQ